MSGLPQTIQDDVEDTGVLRLELAPLAVSCLLIIVC